MARDEAYQEAERRIEAARQEGATELNLVGIGLTALPEAIASLTPQPNLNNVSSIAQFCVRTAHAKLRYSRCRAPRGTLNSPIVEFTLNNQCMRTSVGLESHTTHGSSAQRWFYPNTKPCNPWIARGLVVSLFAVLFMAHPALAHKVEVSGTVGGTSHIEPNDNPRAGTPSLVWFALTQKGGTLIPLKDCTCELAIYSESQTATAFPLQTPPLKAISAEGYRDIPGANVTFPQVGAYTLVIRGKAIAPATFQPFELRFPIMVVAGPSSPSALPFPSPSLASPPTATPTPALPTPAPPSDANPPSGTQPLPQLILGLSLAIVVVVLLAWLIWHQKFREKK